MYSLRNGVKVNDGCQSLLEICRIPKFNDQYYNSLVQAITDGLAPFNQSAWGIIVTALGGEKWVDVHRLHRTKPIVSWNIVSWNGLN